MPPRVVGGAGAIVSRGCSCLQIRGELRLACHVAQACGLVSAAGTRVLLGERRAFGVGKVWLFDIPGWITLLLGGLLALITLFTSCRYVHLPFIGAVALNQQIGVLLLAALVPALVVDCELREIEFKRREIEFEKLMKQLKSESLRVRSETEQIEKENARLDALNSTIDAILFSSGTSSTPPTSTPGESGSARGRRACARGTGVAAGRRAALLRRAPICGAGAGTRRCGSERGRQLRWLLMLIRWPRATPA